MKLLEFGKRSKVYKLLLFAVKIEREDSKAIDRIKNERKWLKTLNKFGIGPKLYFGFNDLMFFELIRGERILDYFKHANFKEKKEVVNEVFRQCRIMDKLKVDKLEMHHPVKHIIIGRKVVMLDFERCKYSVKPKNVTQFCQFLLNYFEVDSGKLRKLLQDYKKDYKEETFKKIVELF